MNKAVAAVDEQRQWDRLMAMARLGAIPGDGVNRACLTALDRQARRLLIGWATEIGATVSVDAAANLWLRLEGTDPRAAAVVTGSHMDTQPNGGRFDGIYGVIAGLEALTALYHAGVTLHRPVEVVAWTNEEGGRFAPGCMGSMAWSGFRRIENFADVVDPDGVRFADALAAHLAAENDLPRRPLAWPASCRRSTPWRGRPQERCEPPPSWPALCRPPTSCLVSRGKVVDGWAKPGHDGKSDRRKRVRQFFRRLVSDRLKVH